MDLAIDAVAMGSGVSEDWTVKELIEKYLRVLMKRQNL